MKWSVEEKEMYCLETFGPREWLSSMCRCRAILNVPRINVRPCSYEHIPWCWRIGIREVERVATKWDNANPPDSYKKVLEEYLDWRRGFTLSFGEKIGGFAHGKASREWHIKNYREDYLNFLFGKEGLYFTGEELLVTTPLSLSTFRAIYYRDPEPDLVSHFLLENISNAPSRSAATI